MSGDFLFENTLTPRTQDSLGKFIIYLGYFFFALLLLYVACQNKIIRKLVDTNVRVINTVLTTKRS